MSEMDKILRNKLYEHGSAMPNDMWDRIEGGIKKRKKRRGLWLLLPLGLLGLGFMSMFYFLQPPHDTAGLNESSPHLVTSLTDGAEGNQQGEKTRGTVLLLEEEAAGFNDAKAFSTQQTENEVFSTKNPNTKELRSTEKKTKPNSSEPQAPANRGEDFTTNRTELPGESKAEKYTTSIAEQPKEDLMLNSDERRENLMDVSLLSVLHGNIDLEKRNFPDPIGCPTFSNRMRPNIFVEAYYKPFYAHKMLAANSAEIGETYLGLRRDSEQTLYSWSAGVNIGWISDYNVGVKAGAEYEVINERFRYTDPEAIRNQTVITIDTVFNTDGSFMVNSDTSVVEVPGTEMQEIANHHRTLSIPIHALYHIAAGDFAFEFSGGPIFNVTYRNRGKIVDPSNEDQWFTKGRSGAYDVFRDRLSVSFSLSASIMYSLNERIQVYARPEFKFHPTSIAKNSSPFTQQYLNSGLSVGVRYYISGNPNF